MPQSRTPGVGVANGRECNLLDGDAGGVMVNVVVNVENELIPPLELMAATDTVYSALGTKSRSVTLVLDVYTVMMPQVQPVSWYLTLQFPITASHTLECCACQDTTAVPSPVTTTVRPVGG